MFLGNLFLSLAFASCAIALSGYLLSVLGRESYRSLGRRAYLVFTGLTVALAALFLYQILSHNFQVEYVRDYSSSDLSFPLLLSTFWAGQVGTFLLWLLFVALIGLLIYRRDNPETATVMLYYLSGALFLLALLAVRTPFRLLPVAVEEGHGLNPLLQNFWMIIHPPVVFIGYALMAVPFSYAMAALTRNDYSNWTGRVLPWALLSSAVLGLGIFLGGYWAYETLGWGGYWGWDPVENASLVPWLTSLALLHGLLVERKYGQLRKSNLLLAASGFLLVIYGTFLTRSGVLADFSVHSFTDLGMNMYLVAFLVGLLILILSLIALRFRRIKPLKKTDDPWSADFLTAIGMVVTTVFAVLVLLGTSAPLITRLPFFSEPANVDIGYYTRIALPIGVIIALLAGLTPFLKPGNPPVSYVLKRSLPSLAAAAAGTLLGLASGVDSIRHALILFCAVYALSASAQMLIASPRMLGRRMGGHLAHIGLGMMLIGFLGSSAYTTGERAVLSRGEASDVMGYAITYMGIGPDSAEKRSAVYLDVESDGNRFTADPRFYRDEYSGGIMREPYIKSRLLYDLYFAPEKIETRQPGEAVSLNKGETASIAGWDVTFHGFDMSSHDEPGSIRVGAVVTAESGGDSVRAVPKLAIMADGDRKQVPAVLDSLGTLLALDAVDPADRAVQLRIYNEDEPPRDVLVLEISKKPLVLLVWLGAFLIASGTLIASYRRFTTARP